MVAYRNGAPVRLSDVATVVEGPENVRQAAWMNDRPAVIVNIQRQPGANIIGVVNRIKRLLPQLRASLPSSVDITVLTDRTTTIRASVADVQFELILTVALVVMVMFLFLRSLSATVIPSIAVPISLIGTFGVMYLLGYSLNNLSLMALTISTGFVVDDAIVMIENIARYIEEGESPLQAALKGSEQIGFTIVSLTVSLIAVLIPLLFMGDVVGRLFREFAITLSVTILVSAVVSLTLTPMMCAKLLRHRPGAQQGRIYRATERGFNAVIAWYGTTLRWVLRHQPATLVVTVATLVLTILALRRRPQGLLPRAGHRGHPGHLGGAGGHLLHGHGRAAAGPGARHPQGPGRGEPLVVHRRGRGQHDAQQRAHPDQPQAARRALRGRAEGHPAPPAGAGGGRGHHPLHAAGPGPHGRGPGQPDAVPVRDAVRRRRASSRSGRGGSTTG